MTNLKTVIKSTALFASIIILLSACSSQQSLNVRHIRNLDAGHRLEGFYYALPRTRVNIDVKVVKTEETPGPFAAFASNLLGLDNVIKEHSVQYHIAEVKISSYAEPDPTEFYFVEHNPNLNQESPIFISLSEAGLITSLNRPFDNIEFLRSTPEEKEYGFFGSEATFNHFIEKGLQERIDTIIESVKMDTIFVERQTLRRSWVEKPSEVRAREVADYILRLRDKKFNLITGFAEITYSRESLQYMFEQMEKQENDYLELFTGKITQSSIQYKYNYLPSKSETDNSRILFYFNQEEGVLYENKTGADAISIEASRSNTTRQLGVFAVRNHSREDVSGFFYRIPEHGTINLNRNQTPIAEARMLINQFGIITTLPALDMEIEFYPNTGSIKSAKKIME